MIVIFPLVETIFQQNPSFWLVETDFRANNGLARMQHLFTNTFPLNGEIGLSVAGMPKNGRKRMFPLVRKSVPLAGIRLFFKNGISTSKKYLQIKRILFQVDRKSVSTSRKGKFV